MSVAFASAWSLMKAPLYAGGASGWSDEETEEGLIDGWLDPIEDNEMSLDEYHRQSKFNHLFPVHMNKPIVGDTYGGFGDTYWTSADDMARGSVSIEDGRVDWTGYQSRPGDAFIHHFEVAEPLRGQGKGQEYLKEMVEDIIARIRESNTYTKPPPRPVVHATRVEWPQAGFWNKMVDRGIISSASERREPRYTFDGQHIAPRIFDDKLIPVDRLGVNE